jgi:hypothetical protein
MEGTPFPKSSRVQQADLVAGPYSMGNFDERHMVWDLSIETGGIGVMAPEQAALYHKMLNYFKKL